MAKQAKPSGAVGTFIRSKGDRRKVTSIGSSANSRPKNKHKRRMSKKYRGQGR